MRYTLIIFVIFSHNVLSQSKFTIEPEIGVNSFGLPKLDNRAGGKEKIWPVPSPLLGLWATRYVANHVFISFGFQYTHTTQKNHTGSFVFTDSAKAWSAHLLTIGSLSIQ